MGRVVGLLISERYSQLYRDELSELQRQLLPGAELRLVLLPTQPSTGETPVLGPDQEFTLGRAAALPAGQLEAIDCAYASEDLQFAWSNMLAFFAVCREAPNLRWLQISWVGIDFPMFQAVTPKRLLTITNAAGTNAMPVATSVLAALLSLHRGLHHWLRAQHEGKWLDRETLPARRDLAGQRALVCGFGAIGQQVGRVLRRNGLRVVGVKRTARGVDAEVADEVVAADQLERQVGLADYVVICAPLTDATRGLFDAKMLARMKSTACLLNVGRGPIVDELALAEALQTGRLAGAYLDVFSKEPLPRESPLWSLPNVILSPHDSASCVDNAGRVQAIFIENLSRFGRNQDARQLSNVVWQSKDLAATSSNL